MDGALNNSCDIEARSMPCRSEATNMYTWRWRHFLIPFRPQMLNYAGHDVRKKGNKKEEMKRNKKMENRRI